MRKILLGNIKGPRGIQGIQGERGEPFAFTDLTDEQLNSLAQRTAMVVIKYLEENAPEVDIPDPEPDVPDPEPDVPDPEPEVPKVYYVSMGDSIAAGHTIDGNWATNYGEGSQYGKNGNLSTTIVTGSYTELIHNELVGVYGADNVTTKSFARSGDTVADLMDKLSHAAVVQSLEQANLVTICIGANDVLQPALSHLEEYINTGDLAAIAANVEANLAALTDDTNTKSYKALFDKLSAINPNARYVFTTVYNPYKHLWLEEGQDGFFGPLINSVPDIEYGLIDTRAFIRDSILGTPEVEMLFDRVNGLCDWAEKYVNALNNVLRSKINAYGDANFLLADTKAVFDPVPDRPIAADRHYNDLVSVEYTRGYDTASMNWGSLWGDGDAYSFWWGIFSDYGLNITSIVDYLIPQIVEKVIVPDIDPHPEFYGHHAMKQAFADALGWITLPRYIITFNANGGSGVMDSQRIVALDNMTAYVNLRANAFVGPAKGDSFVSWQDTGGATYTDGQIVSLRGDLVLTAQWSNLYAILYMHTNHTNLYGDDDTGHTECYALYINGELMPKLGRFSDGNRPVYSVPYGSIIKVAVSNYNPNEFFYDDESCDVYWNDVSVSRGYRSTEYEFALTSNLIIDFRWKISGSLATFDAKSWEDCYITTV